MNDTAGLVIYIVVGIGVLMLVLPKYREVLIPRVRDMETSDHVLFGFLSFLSVIGWPVVVLGWTFATLGKLLGQGQ